MSTRKVMVLIKMDFPGTTARFWFGSGAHMDRDNHLWRAGGQLPEDAFTNIQYAFSGEASVLEMSLSGIPQDIADLAYEETQESDIIGSRVQVLLQSCNEHFEALASGPVVKFTGEIIDIKFSRKAIDDQEQPYIKHTVTLSVANAFHARKSRRNSVLSDADQRAYSLKTNPDLPQDLCCERIVLMASKSITWPRL